MPFMYQRRIALFDGTSGDSSNYTAGPHFVGDYAYISVSWHTDTNSASILTLQGSNDDGFGAAIVNWSNLTGITARGLYVLDPGVRWMRVLRNSNESLAEAYVQART